MFEFPWTRKRREAAKAEADRIAKLERERQERRAAQILADQIHRSQLQAKYRSQIGQAVVTPIKPAYAGLTAQQAAQADRRPKLSEEPRTGRSEGPAMALDFTDSGPVDCGASDSSCGSSD